MQPVGFLSVPEHTGLILCSDGVPLFKSSDSFPRNLANMHFNYMISFKIILGQSLWPIELSFTSLPPHIRMNVDYLLVGGIWLGPVKPYMKTIQQPIIEKVNYLNADINTPQGIKLLKSKLLLGVFHLPAKAAAVNMMQYNGRYGCLYCLDEGMHISNCRLYLPCENHRPRNMKHMSKWAKQATQEEKPIFGVKGPSILSSSIEIVKSVPKDYMHAILEGITKSLFNCWFDSMYHKFTLANK